MIERFIHSLDETFHPEPTARVRARYPDLDTKRSRYVARLGGTYVIAYHLDDAVPPTLLKEPNLEELDEAELTRMVIALFQDKLVLDEPR